MLKRIALISVVFALSLPTTVLTNSAFANTSNSGNPANKNAQTKQIKTSKAIKCQSTTAIAHAPVDVPMPKKVMSVRQLKKMMKQLVIQTNCGEIVIEPFIDQARVTLTAVTALARGGFYDKSLCHRLTTNGIYVLQCGDPTATGGGGPSFTFGVENLPNNVANNYPEGVVGMANSGRPDSNGSQFFIVYKDSTLPPNYTIWGRVVSGLDIVKEVAKSGVKDGSSDGNPKQTIAIERIITR
jgi:peptidyl-prolyl cis-trans isomerase B (cyclophilin B)